MRTPPPTLRSGAAAARSRPRHWCQALRRRAAERETAAEGAAAMNRPPPQACRACGCARPGLRPAPPAAKPGRRWTSETGFGGSPPAWPQRQSASRVPRTEGSLRVGCGRGLRRDRRGLWNRDRREGRVCRGRDRAHHGLDHVSGRGRDRFGRARGGLRRRSGRGRRRRSGGRSRQRLVDRRLDGRDGRGRDLVHLRERALHLRGETAERRRRRVCAAGTHEGRAHAHRDGDTPAPPEASRSSSLRIVQPIGRSAPQGRSRNHRPEARSAGGA